MAGEAEPQKAIVAFSCCTKSVAIVWVTSGVADIVSEEDFDEEWFEQGAGSNPHSGLWTWEGKINWQGEVPELIGSWRLPTQRELEIANALQVKNILP